MGGCCLSLKVNGACEKDQAGWPCGKKIRPASLPFYCVHCLGAERVGGEQENHFDQNEMRLTLC